MAKAPKSRTRAPLDDRSKKMLALARQEGKLKARFTIACAHVDDVAAELKATRAELRGLMADGDLFEPAAPKPAECAQ